MAIWTDIQTVWKDVVEFHTGVRKVYPDRIFAFGYTPLYDYAKAGYTPEQIRSLGDDLAKMGVVWQVQPTWAVSGINMHIEDFARDWQRDGIAGYLETVSKPSKERSPIVDGFYKLGYAGSYLADAYFATVAGRET